MIKIECKNALQEMLLIEELSKRKDVKVVTKETQLDEAASVDAILTKIVAGLKTLNVITTVYDVRGLFLGGGVGKKSLVGQLEKLGFDSSAGSYLENKDFFKKINLTKTEYNQLVRASTV